MDSQSLFSVKDFTTDPFFIQDDDRAALTEIGPLFSVPALPEKPQDPILDSLHDIHPAKHLSTPQIRAGALPQELAVVTAAYANPLLDPLDNLELWDGILLKRRIEVGTRSARVSYNLINVRTKHFFGTECAQMCHWTSRHLPLLFQSRMI